MRVPKFAGYASDITRTYSLRDADFAALIRRMNEMQHRYAREFARVSTGANVHLRAQSLDSNIVSEADITTV